MYFIDSVQNQEIALVDALQWNLAPITPSDILCALLHVLRAQISLTRSPLQYNEDSIWREVRALAFRALYASSLGILLSFVQSLFTPACG